MVLLTLTNVNDYRIGKDTPGIDREILALPDALIDEPSADVAKTLRRLIDALWQAAGERESLNYDGNGNWKPA